MASVLALSSAAAREQPELIYAFRNYTRPEPIRMLLVGEIRSKVKVARAQDVKSPYLGYDTRHDQVTVKVVNRTGLKVGQKLYVIDKNPYHQRYRNGLISGEIEVQSIFYHPFFGWVLTGTGILLRVREGMFVARTLDTEKLERAFERKKRGDFHLSRGEREQAVASYHAALEADRSLPEAHAALGSIYLSDARRRRRETPVRALAEFDQAWKSRTNFRYDSDRLRFLLAYLEALRYARETTPAQGRLARLDAHLGRSREAAREALALKMDSSTARFELAQAEYELSGLRVEQARSTARSADRLAAGSPRRREATEKHARLLKESREAQDSTRKLLGELLKQPVSDGRIHALAFRAYFDLLREVESTGSEDAVRALLAQAFYSNDFHRWEDVTFPARSTGALRLRRLLRYHGELYLRFRGGRAGDPGIESRLRALSAATQ